ncbi:MAG TPA: hypothetical protein VGM92_14395 [Candidatus Kapabacteria bacterium]
MIESLRRLFILSLFAGLFASGTLRAQCEGPDEINFCTIDSARLETLLARFPCLANRQVDVGGDPWPPLVAAISCGRMEIVRMLLEDGARIDMTWGALIDTNLEGPYLTPTDRDPIWEAFSDRKTWIYGTNYQLGDVSDEWEMGDTMITFVLEWASNHPRQIGFDKSFYPLLGEWAKPASVLGREGFLLSVQEVLDSCLSSPELFTDSTLIRLLISSGGRIKARSKDWISIAIDQSSPELLKFWISHGAAINFRDRNGDTPLYHAKSELDSISEIRNNNRGLTDAFGEQAWSQTDEDNFQVLTQIVEILEEAGGRE